jgi:acetoin utilization deacetylase AcuC-like enzyme
LCEVHTSDHLEHLQQMSLTGGGFDTDTYCAPGSWEAMLDGTSAWLEATALAAAVEGPVLALSRPAGHHATQNVAMGFGLVNFAAAAVKAHLAAHPLSRVAILDWDVHHGNGVAAIFREEPRVRYASTHEAGGFPQTGMREEERGPLGNVLNLPLPKGAGGEIFLAALRQKALPFLLAPTASRADAPQDDTCWDRPPELLLVCAGYDALESDPLGTMTLRPEDFAAAVRMILDDFGYPAERVALGLEGGYDLDSEVGMPAGLVATCRALVDR